MPVIRVLLVDDHPVARLGFASFLQMQHDLELVAEADSVATAVAAYRRIRPDIAVVDFRLGDGTALDVLEEVRRIDPDPRIVVLTGATDDESAYRAIRHGVVGYLLKSSPMHELVRALREVAAGHCVVPPTVARAVEARASEPDLTERELEVLQLVAAGRSNPEIAVALSISLGTARAHVSRILEKLGAADRAEATAIAFRRGLL